MKSPAEMSSAIDSAICAVTSVVRNRAAARAPDGWPACALIVETRSGRVLCSAGNNPNSRPVATDSTAAKSTTAGCSSNCSDDAAVRRQQRAIERQRPPRHDQTGDPARAPRARTTR